MCVLVRTKDRQPHNHIGKQQQYPIVYFYAIKTVRCFYYYFYYNNLSFLFIFICIVCIVRSASVLVPLSVDDDNHEYTSRQ